jgi:hypothetical protein
MSNPKALSSQASGVKLKVVSLNRGSSLSKDSAEQIRLDRIFHYKFTKCNVLANECVEYDEDRYEKFLVANERLCTLAGLVISHSHLVTLWKNTVSGNSKGNIKIVHEWLTSCVIIG